MVVDSPCALAYSGGNMVIKKEEEIAVPVSQLKNVVINTTAVSLTSKLLNELANSGIGVLFCNEKYQPSLQIMPLMGNFRMAGNIRRQSEWTEENKALTWREIVRAKIESEQALLQKLGKKVPAKLEEYKSAVLPGDPANREGQAARIYFNTAFGESFFRRRSNGTNAALNYGYAVILSSMSRIVCIHGYHVSLGIHHINTQNPCNFSCDLIEPFRAFVDRAVLRDPPDGGGFCKAELIGVLHEKVRYGNKSLIFTDAQEMFFLDVLRTLESGDPCIKEIGFE